MICGTWWSNSNLTWSMTMCMLHVFYIFMHLCIIFWLTGFQVSDENQILEFFYVPGGLFCCVIAAFFILYGWVFHHIKFPGCSIRVSTTFDIGRYIFCILAFKSMFPFYWVNWWNLKGFPRLCSTLPMKMPDSLGAWYCCVIATYSLIMVGFSFT